MKVVSGRVGSVVLGALIVGVALVPSSAHAANPTTLTASVLNASVALGQPIRDEATLSGAQSPVSGTLTFKIYGPNDSNCSKTPINTETINIFSGGAYYSTNYTPTSVGTYRYTVAYSGDMGNTPSTVDCTAANQTATVSVATTSLSASVLNASVALGQPIRDEATLSGAQSPVSGTLTFKIYGPNDSNCSKTPINTEMVNVGSNGGYYSTNYTPSSVGTYRYTVAYSGDTGNTPSSVDCTAANQTVTVSVATTSLSASVLNASVALGQPIRDEAILSGTQSPVGGTLTFKIYGPNDSNCSKTPINTEMVNVGSGGQYYSTNYTPTSAGTYRYTVAYSGDSGNTPSTVDCTAANQTATVSVATTSLSASVLNASVALGQPIRDEAILSGAQSPVGGTLTFKIYGPNDSNCSKTAINTEMVNVGSNGGYYSTNYTPTSAGTYRYTVAYSGDSGNTPSTVDCTAANQTATVSVATTSLAAAVVNPSVTFGQPIRDAATLSGAQSPVSGTVTFKIYGPGDDTCSKTAINTEMVNVGSNGQYFSTNYMPARAGSYRYTVAYSGDTGNTPSSLGCNAANQTVLVKTVTWMPVRIVTVTRSHAGLTFHWRVTNPRGIAGFNLFAGAARLNHTLITVHRRPEYTFHTPAVSGRYHLSVVLSSGRHVDVGVTARSGTHG